MFFSKHVLLSECVIYNLKYILYTYLIYILYLLSSQLSRDEDGKTPLDKARERNDDGHREVASLLQSPGDWMVQDQAQSSGSGQSVGQGQDSLESSEEVGPRGTIKIYIYIYIYLYISII